MNKIIKQQLLKVQEFDLSNVPDDITSIKFDKINEIKLEIDKYYIIELDDYSLNPPFNDPITSNWNNSNIPNCRWYKCDIIQILGDMIKINGIGYDYLNKIDLSNMWSGWVKKEHIKVLERL